MWEEGAVSYSDISKNLSLLRHYWNFDETVLKNLVGFGPGPVSN